MACAEDCETVTAHEGRAMATSCALIQLPAHPPEEQRCAEGSIPRTALSAPGAVADTTVIPAAKSTQAAPSENFSCKLVTSQDLTEQSKDCAAPQNHSAIRQKLPAHLQKNGSAADPGGAFTRELDTSEMTPKQRNSMLKIWIDLRWSTITASILLPRQSRPVLLPN